MSARQKAMALSGLSYLLNFTAIKIEQHTRQRRLVLSMPLMELMMWFWFQINKYIPSTKMCIAPILFSSISFHYVLFKAQARAIH